MNLSVNYFWNRLRLIFEQISLAKFGDILGKKAQIWPVKDAKIAAQDVKNNLWIGSS